MSDVGVQGCHKLGCLGALVGVLGFGGDAQAASISFNLDCVLNTTPCVPVALSFGTVTLTDGTGANTGKVLVAVNLAGTGQKFRDLLLNFGGPETSFTSSDGQSLTFGSNAFALNPYNGTFDLGSTGTRVGTATTAIDVRRQPGELIQRRRLHVQGQSGEHGALRRVAHPEHRQCEWRQLHGSSTGTNCAPGVTGDGSLKIGGRLPDT